MVWGSACVRTESELLPRPPIKNFTRLGVGNFDYSPSGECRGRGFSGGIRASLDTFRSGKRTQSINVSSSMEHGERAALKNSPAELALFGCGKSSGMMCPDPSLILQRRLINLVGDHLSESKAARLLTSLRGVLK